MTCIRDRILEGEKIYQSVYRVLKGGELKMAAFPAVRHKDIGIDSCSIETLLDEVIRDTGKRYYMTIESDKEVIYSTVYYPNGSTVKMERAATMEELTARG